MESNNQAKLFAKIALVMGQVRTLEKTGENKFDRYKYVTADAIATRIGSALAENGVAFLPSILSVETSEYQTQKGGTNFRSVVHMQMTFACGETGATFTIPWFGESIDRSDKSITKATVSAIKYALLKTFLLAGGDEEDADAESPSVEARPTAPRTQSSTREPQNATEAQESNGEVLFSHEADGEVDKLHRHFHALGRELYNGKWDEVRHRNAKRVSQGRTESSAELTPDEVQALINGMNELKQKRTAQANGVAA